MSSVKQKVQELAEALPKDATWAQVQYEVYVRAKIEEGETAIDAGRTVPHDEVKRRFPAA